MNLAHVLYHLLRADLLERACYFTLTLLLAGLAVVQRRRLNV